MTKKEAPKQYEFKYQKSSGRLHFSVLALQEAVPPRELTLFFGEMENFPRILPHGFQGKRKLKLKLSVINQFIVWVRRHGAACLFPTLEATELVIPIPPPSTGPTKKKA